VKNIEAQGRIGALIVWINSADAMRPIGSIRKALCSRLRALSDSFDDANSDWRPIETAPKDGTHILLGSKEDEETASVSTLGWWQDAEDDGRDYMGADGGFVDHTFNYFYPGRSFGSPTYQRDGTQPTHWMPLPSPPKAEGPDEVGEQVRAVSGEPA
jgi:hypothetical protein